MGIRPDRTCGAIGYTPAIRHGNPHNDQAKQKQNRQANHTQL